MIEVIYDGRRLDGKVLAGGSYVWRNVGVDGTPRWMGLYEGCESGNLVGNVLLEKKSCRFMKWQAEIDVVGFANRTVRERTWNFITLMED